MDNKELARDLLVALIGTSNTQGENYKNFVGDITDTYYELLKQLEEKAPKKMSGPAPRIKAIYRE